MEQKPTQRGVRPMVTKELLENRWKAGLGALIALLTATLAIYSFSWAAMLGPMTLDTPILTAPDRELLRQALTNADIWTWVNWFGKNAGIILAALAAVLGGTTIAGEVSRGTILLLLSKPISRDRVLLTKYATAALILLGVSGLASAAIAVSGWLLGYPQPLGGLLVATVLVWLGSLSILGWALLFSTLAPDSLRAVAGALVVAVLMGVPGLTPGGRPWNLAAYWASLPAYQGQAFPALELALCLIMAALPLVGALLLFRRRAF